MQIKELINKGVLILGEHGNSALDCEVLLCHVLGVEKSYLVAHADEEVSGELSELFFQYVGRVADGEPVAYITGSKEFFGLDFYVDKRVLIPRPETEHLVERIIEFLKGREGKLRILDVGTGSGNIAVSLAVTLNGEVRPEVLVDAVEFDHGACEVAKLNAEAHGVERRVHVFQGNLLDEIDEGEKFDVIVANLPYIGEVENRFVSAEAEKYEPNIALFGGHTGLELYKKMFQQIVDKEIEFDLLIGEFGFAQGEAMRALLERHFQGRWAVEQDYAGIDRMFVVKGGDIC